MSPRLDAQKSRAESILLDAMLICVVALQVKDKMSSSKGGSSGGDGQPSSIEKKG